MNGIESLVEPFNWRNRLIKTSWDNCVVSIGISAGIFANAEVMKTFSGGWPVIETSLGICITLATAIGIAAVRKSIVGQTQVHGWKVLLCLALSGAAIGFPSYVAFRY
jgi:hypothetical protein